MNARVKIPDPVPREVILTMTEKEASHLLEAIRRIGGPPSGPRGTFVSIGGALRSVGVVRSHELGHEGVTGIITFTEDTT